MKVACALLLCSLFSVSALLAQQDPATNSTTSNSSQTSKIVKKLKHKAKKSEQVTARAVDDDGVPMARAQHIKQLMRAVPGNEGEPNNGPDAAALDAFQQRAYPDTDIPLDRILNSRTAAASLNSRFPTGKGRPGTWVTVGPTQAVYPISPFRTFSVYVPNKYDAASRTTTLAVSPNCAPGNCMLWATPAGGGVWRTKNALDGQPNWTYLSSSFAINSVGSITLDPNDPTGNTLWVGTGEANACGSGCEAGVGLYKSTDGGDTWTGPFGGSVFNARAVGTIAVKFGDPDTIFAGTTRAIRGVSSVCCDGAVSFAPGAAKWGLYKSTDGGQTWTFVHNGSSDPSLCQGNTLEAGNGTPCSPRGVRRVLFDPSNANIVYASSYARGVWRSTDGGSTWTQIKPSLDSTNNTMRPELAVNTLPNGKTRLYVAEGGSGATNSHPNDFSQLFRTDDATAASPAFLSLTSKNPANSGYGSFNYCEGQCWYDNFVRSPAGYPDIVYLGGSYAYGETGNISNGRGVVLSTDAGVSFTDMTMDATDPIHPNGIHPDQHFLVVNPNDPFQFWESSDGGVIRSTGSFANISANCNSRLAVLQAIYGANAGVALARCQQLLSSVPSQLTGMNKGLTTLQFQALSVNPFNVNDVQGGTQDNGTWESTGNPNVWTQTIFGDGGLSGFDIADRNFRFHTYAGPEPDVNFTAGATADWNWVGDIFFVQPEPSQFYFPIISDPAVSGTMYAGTGHVWRTKDHGIGPQTLAQFRANCNEFTGSFTYPLGLLCGDWVSLGDPSPAGELIGNGFGSDRTGGNGIAALSRTVSDSSTLWAATSAGRVFVSKNANVDPATSVTFARIDTLAVNPKRFVSGIYIDPANSNHAWITYSGYTATTPSTPGHVFDVLYDPVHNAATWTDLSYDLGDLPITCVVRDDARGDLYVCSDFGVHLLASGSTSWTAAAPGMPNVEVAGLTIVPSARKLYAATHGLGAWLLNLP
jgi:hypothetical protein